MGRAVAWLTVAAAVVAGTSATVAGSASGATPAVRIDVGSSVATTVDGVAWRADVGYTGGTRRTTGSAIAGTTADPMSRSYRYGMSS